jgi:hypothetical protein
MRSSRVDQSTRIAELAKRQGYHCRRLLEVARVERRFERGSVDHGGGWSSSTRAISFGNVIRPRNCERMGAFVLAADLPYEAMSSLSFESRKS